MVGRPEKWGWEAKLLVDMRLNLGQGAGLEEALLMSTVYTLSLNT